MVQPWLKYQGQSASQAQPDAPQEDIVLGRDPYKANAEGRAQVDQSLQIEAANRARVDQQLQLENAARQRKEWEATHNPDGTPKVAGKALPDAAARRIEGGVGQFSQLAGSLSGFKDEYAGNTATGSLENTIQGAFSGFGSEGQRDWWSNFQSVDNVIRHELFGAALTPTEKAAYERTTVDPSLDPKIVRQNIGRRVEILRGALDRQKRFMVANGYNPEAVNILYEPLTAMEALQGSTSGNEAKEPAPVVGGADTGTANIPGNPLQTGNIPGDAGPATQLQTGNTKRVAQTGVENRYKELLTGGASGDELAAYLQSVGITDPKVLTQAKVQARYREKFPNVPISDYSVDFTQDLPVSMADQALNAVGQSGAGAYAINAADALSAGTLDNVAGMTGGNAERVRAGMGAVSQANPTASAIGQVSGGVMASLTGEAALARAGVAGGLGRGVLADSAYSAASGAGNADGGNRGMNALMGAGTSALGSVAGTGATNALARVATPTGRGMNALYDAGVTPTIGQRGAAMASQGGVRGTVGRVVSDLEQKAQSIPVIGSAIRGARQESRDQFQVGAFNEALKEVGEQLPKGMKPGTAPNEYAQKTFSRVYAEARSGMRLVADEEMANDIANLAGDVEVLGPQAQQKLRVIIENNITNRFSDGELTGEMFKKTISDLEKRATTFRKGNSAEDQALAEVITEIKFTLDAAARRHSDPESVALLDAADAGYAKLVRIEGAAARAGGEAGTFSPTQFEREVQKQSGGVRSRSYSRGDALMQDYANEGKALVDTVPDSGTAGRVMAGVGAAGAATLSAKAAAILGGLAVAYAPGTRKVMQKALSPAGPRRKAIAQQLEKRARLVGSTIAATGAALSPGTSPSP